MANGYTKTFTLRDIFNNEKLADKIPLVNYNETVDNAGKLHQTTKMQSLMNLVFNSAKTSARPYYKTLQGHRAGNLITLDGELNTEINTAVMGVYRGVLTNKKMFEMTVNNADMIRSALKEGAKEVPEPKLWLKIGSMQEIKGMTKRQLNAFMHDVMRNIFYNPEFAKTQKKYGVSGIAVNGSTNYDRRRNTWLRKVGEI